MGLKDKVIVITGSTRGIGHAAAIACAQRGAKVVICSRHRSSVEEVCRIFKKDDFQVTGISADVSESGDIKKLFDHALNTFGKIDVWINNAGLSGGFRFLNDISDQEIKDILNVNITGTLLSCRIIIPYFIDKNGGVIINMSGRGGKGEASPYLTPYAASKTAVTYITKNLSKEYKDHLVSIHSVMPGMVETGFFKNLKVSPGLEARAKSIPYVLKAFGGPVEAVGEFIDDVADQKPGEKTGRQYSMIKGFRLIRGIILMTLFGMSGKLKS